MIAVIMFRMSAHRSRVCAAAVFACAAWVLDAQDARVDFAKVREAARAEIASGAMPGLAVAIVHDGRVVFAEGFGVASVEHPSAPPTPDTVFQIGSAGKMLTAAAVLETSGDAPARDAGRAVDDGRSGAGNELR
jgi:CubicO group peptidase (beta-lactamase class C family)